MIITETIVITRANTSISWFPSIVHIDDPYNSNKDVTFTETVNNSEDGLTKTIVRVWTDKQAFIDCHVFNGYADIYFDNLIQVGMTSQRTITTTN